MDKALKELEIYVHVPFCVKKCNYCDFLSYSASKEAKTRYIEALLNEIRCADDKYHFDINQYTLRSIYIGGGTPSVLRKEHIGLIINEIENKFRPILNGKTLKEAEVEITIEVNPGTVDASKLEYYRSIGINRLSIGLQSAHDEELKLLGRIHTYDEFEETYKSARNAGFENINVDVMTAIPLQTMESLEETVKKVIELTPEHVSSYSLIIEEGTPFYVRYNEEELFSEEDERNMYYRCRDMLALAGYRQYEISNYSKNGYESRHNTGYWSLVEYIGLGLGASSYINSVRCKNTGVMDVYCDAPFSTNNYEEYEKIDIAESMSEFMFLGLRMMRGVSKTDFIKKYGQSVESIYGDELEGLMKDGMIEAEGERIRLTSQGIDYGNYVFSRFV